MKVCLILEGCYPYVRGGVSSWAHQYMSASPEIEFVLWTIHASRKDAVEPLYALPPNVTEHVRVFLDEGYGPAPGAGLERALSEGIAAAFERVLNGRPEGFDELIGLVRAAKGASGAMMTSGALLDLARRLSSRTEGLGLADAYYGLQSMLMPICQVFASGIPEADAYHAAVAGYGGLLGAMAHRVTGKPFLLTEHGIYPREREEELLAADWTARALQPLWADLFYDMSRYAYAQAERVTALFDKAMERQVLIGCDPGKCRVIPNGIRTDLFGALPDPVPSGEIHIGAFVRFAAIKDLKTMIHAFHAAHQRLGHIRLHLMGGTDDEAYRDACLTLIRRLGLERHVLVEGHVDALSAMARMDMTMLSSISEGQPLTVLESMAAGRPCVATRVGNCEGLIETPVDGIGAAGLCCTPMSPEEMAACIVALCEDPSYRAACGQNGRRRVARRYRLEDMLRAYHALYGEVENLGGHRV